MEKVYCFEGTEVLTHQEQGKTELHRVIQIMRIKKRLTVT